MPRAARPLHVHHETPNVRYRSLGLPATLFAASLLCALAALALWSRALIAVEAATPQPLAQLAIGERTVTVPRHWLVPPARGAAPDRVALHAPLGAFLGREEIAPDLVIGLSIARADDALPPSDRPSLLYGRFLVANVETAPNGLLRRAFAAGTPYEGESLYLAPPQGRTFAARCLEDEAGAEVLLPCLAEIRRAGLDAQIRLPREALSHWSRIVAKVDALITEGKL